MLKDNKEYTIWQKEEMWKGSGGLGNNPDIKVPCLAELSVIEQFTSLVATPKNSQHPLHASLVDHHAFVDVMVLLVLTSKSTSWSGTHAPSFCFSLEHTRNYD